MYLRLRRFAAGLRFADYPDDAFKIDTLAEQYGRAIYTTHFHPVTTSVAPTGDDGGAGDDAGEDAGAPIADGGTESDGILGVASGNGYAYDTAKAAMGAVALLDMAKRALNGTLFPVGHASDAGAPDANAEPGDGAVPPDTADATAWTHAAVAVLAHLNARARDATGAASSRRS